MDFKKKIDRLRACFYALEIGTVICSLIDKILTFIAISYHGAVETNPLANRLVTSLGVGPAVIIGFIASLMPIILIHLGIRTFKWNKEGHYWLYTIFITFYFTTFFKLVESELRWFGAL